MIYFDNSATTSMYVENLDIISKYSTINFYNPSALYTCAHQVTQDIKNAKQDILKHLGGISGSLVITGSGTESDNMAIQGLKTFKDCRMIVSNIEHSAVWNTAKNLEQNGVKVSYAPVDKFGKVIESEFIKLLAKDVYLVSIMHVSNETGAINDIKKLVELTKKSCPRAKFHSDGVQAVGKIPVNLASLGVDLYSFSAHKFHGMKGCGGLYIKNGVNLSPIIYGGGQENGLRSATENVCGIITMAYSIGRCISELNINNNRLIINYITSKILECEPKTLINTDLNNSASHILSIALPNTRGEVLLHILEDNNIIVGTGSACSSHKGNKRIPVALGIDSDYDMGMVRISIDSSNTLEEAEVFCDNFVKSYNTLKSFITRR